MKIVRKELYEGTIYIYNEIDDNFDTYTYKECNCEDIFMVVYYSISCKKILIWTNLYPHEGLFIDRLQKQTWIALEHYSRLGWGNLDLPETYYEHLSTLTDNLMEFEKLVQKLRNS